MLNILWMWRFCIALAGCDLEGTGDCRWYLEGEMFFLNCTAPGLEGRILGEEQTLLLMGTSGLEPLVALALLSLFCVVVRLFSFLLFRFFSVVCLGDVYL